MTIVWDVDDVLNALTREWLEQEWLPANTSSKVRYTDLISNPPHDLLGMEISRYLESLDRFRLSDSGQSMKPVPEVVRWFETHGQTCSHIALTARPLSSIPELSSWVFRYFGPWIRAFGFVPSPREGIVLPRYQANKKEWLGWISAGDVLVDDNVQNIEDAKALGLATVLVPQPWNQSCDSLHDTLNCLTQIIKSN